MKTMLVSVIALLAGAGVVVQTLKSELLRLT